MTKEYEGRWPSFCCTNHPRYRAYLRHQVYLFCEVGVDGTELHDLAADKPKELAELTTMWQCWADRGDARQ